MPQSPAALGSTALDASAPARADRRGDILQAARACFARSGFHGASMHEICAEARMSPGGVYRYFASKAEIIDAISENYHAQCMRSLTQLHSGGALEDRLTEATLAFIAEHNDAASIALTCEATAESARGGVNADSYRRTEEAARAALIGIIAGDAGCAPGATPPDYPALVELIMAFPVGMILRGAVSPTSSGDQLRPYLRAMFAALLNEARERAAKSGVTA